MAAQDQGPGAKDTIAEILARFPKGPDDERFLDELARILSEPFAGGMEAAANAVGGAVQFGPAGAEALAWARDRGAELVTQVDEASKELIRNLVARQMEAGVTVQNLASDILSEFHGFADYRAERIARTETAFAFNHGAVARYRQAEIEYVRVMDGPGCLPDGHQDGAPAADPDVRGVQEGAEADGQVWSLDEAEAYPVGHPNCVRAFAPIVEAREA